MADRRLQVFHTVARMLSFTKAAEVLKMTQPAVTFQIRQLEEQLNARLFDRSHNRIDLTQAGKNVFEYSERIFNLYEEMETSVKQNTTSVNGTLRIGASATSSQYLLPELLAKFQEQFPSIHIQLKVANTASVVSLLENSFVDIGLIESPVSPKKMVSEVFCKQELIVCMPSEHTLAKKEKLTIHELLEESWIMREEGSSTKETFFNYLQTQGIKPEQLKVAMELGSIEAIKSSVEAKRGIAVLPKEAVIKECKLGTLAAVSFEPLLTRQVLFAYKEQKYTLKAIEELISFASNNNLNLNLSSSLEKTNKEGLLTNY